MSVFKNTRILWNGARNRTPAARTAAKKEYMKMYTLVVEQSWAGGGVGVIMGLMLIAIHQVS